MSNELIRVFPRRTSQTPTDELAFVGGPPLFDLPDLPVHISVTFTWDVNEGKRLQREWKAKCGKAKIGGPAIDGVLRDVEFVPGRYVKQGITITSRGCPKKCPWCYVPKREGPLVTLKDFAVGNVVQDNNLLACDRGHIERVFEMLQSQKNVRLLGGLDVDYLRDWHIELLKSISLYDVWCACDTDAALSKLEKAGEMLSEISIGKKRCYVLIGRGESLIEAEQRLEAVLRLGFLPFAQLFRPATPKIYDPQWKALARKWSRPALYRR